MNTIENNKIIAEFMGMKPHDPKELDGFWTNTIKAHKFDNVMNLQFNSCWNWLMEVVEKIFSLDDYYHFKQTLGQFDTSIRDRFPNKEGVYNQCIEFIKWYNNKNLSINNK